MFELTRDIWIEGLRMFISKINCTVTKLFCEVPCQSFPFAEQTHPSLVWKYEVKKD